MESRKLIYRVFRPQQPDEWRKPSGHVAVIVRAAFSPAPVARTDEEVAAVKTWILRQAGATPVVDLRAYDPDERFFGPRSDTPVRSVETATTAELIAELAKRLVALEGLAAAG